MELTPVDVRRKRGDFRNVLRGYEPSEVDAFLESAAERLEALTQQHTLLSEQSARLESQVEASQRQANEIHEALISAQSLRDEIATEARDQASTMLQEAKRHASDLRKRAEEEARRLKETADAELSGLRLQLVGETERQRQRTEEQVKKLSQELDGLRQYDAALADIFQRRKARFLKALRALLESEMAALQQEERRGTVDGVRAALARSQARLESPPAEVAEDRPTESPEAPTLGSARETGKGREPGSSPLEVTPNTTDGQGLAVAGHDPKAAASDVGRGHGVDSAMGEVVMVPLDLLTEMADGADDPEVTDSEGPHPHGNGRLGTRSAPGDRVDGAMDEVAQSRGHRTGDG